MRPRTDGFDGTLAALAGDADRYFGDPNALLEPVARFERPFSILLRIRVDAAGRRTHAFLKVFKPRHSTPEEIAQLRRFVEREYRAATALHQTVTGRPGLTALRPVALFPEHLAIVTEEVEGKTLDRVLRQGAWRRSVRPQVGAAAARVGRWVRTYQGVTAAEGVVSTDGLRAYLDEADPARPAVGRIGTGPEARSISAGKGGRSPARYLIGLRPYFFWQRGSSPAIPGSRAGSRPRCAAPC